MSTTTGATETSTATSTSQNTIATGFTEIMAEGITHVPIPSDERVSTLLDVSTLDSILTRERLISNITINGSEVWNTNILGNAFDPFDLFTADPLIASLMAPYSGFRGDMEVRVVIKPPGSCMGGMVFSALCEGGNPLIASNTYYADNSTKDNVYTAFSDMFGVLSFEKANDIHFDLPYVYPTDYYDYRYSFSMRSWRIMAYSLAPLQSMIGTTPVANIKIYANFKPGYKLVNAVFQGKENVDGLDGFKKKTKQLRDKAASKVLGVTGGHKISDIASGAAGVAATMAGMIPAIAPFAAPVAAGLATISSVASWLGFTRESLVYHPEPIVPRLMSSFPLVDGIDTSERLIMSNDAVLSIDPSIGGGTLEDPLSFESLRQRWSLVTAFDLTTSTAVGKIIEVPVTPSLGGVYLGYLFLSPGGYYGLPFQYWRGDMEYMIYIPSSTNMRGGLQVLWSPYVTPSFTLAPYSADPTNRLNNVVLDLNQTQQHIIKVPYSSTNMLMVNEVIAENKYSNRTDLTCNGSLTFYLTSPYVAPRAGLISTKVLVLARPGKNMVFAEPRLAINDLGLTAAITLQSGSLDVVDEQNEMFETTILSSPMDQTFDVARILTSETAPSARALMQKFTEVFIAPNTPIRMLHMPHPSNFSGSFAWEGGSNSERDPPSFGVWTWLNHYALLYTGYRGGVRVKLTQGQPYATSISAFPGDPHYPSPEMVLYGTQTPLGVNYPIIQDQLDKTNTVGQQYRTRPTHSVVQTLSPGKAVEFAFPYCSRLKYINPRDCNYGVNSIVNNYDRQMIYINGNITPNSTPQNALNTVQIRVALAGADDISVVRFRRVPGLVAARLVPAI